jgi:hypothetical protein
MSKFFLFFKVDPSIPIMTTATKDTTAIHLTELPEDPEVRFAKAIIDGDVESVEEVLKLLKPDEKCVLMNINIQKILGVCNGIHIVKIAILGFFIELLCKDIKSPYAYYIFFRRFT